jgi:hypothetical protein
LFNEASDRHAFGRGIALNEFWDNSQEILFQEGFLESNLAGIRALILECGDLSPLSQSEIFRATPTCAGN